MKNVNAYTGPQRFAHRGLVQAAPENTLGAFQGAVDGGYEGIEIDVQMTRDGEIVIAHDSNFTSDDARTSRRRIKSPDQRSDLG
ncbi:MAG: glycerophosphodiester phosphodiesterase [Dysosmobacter sp.]